MFLVSTGHVNKNDCVYCIHMKLYMCVDVRITIANNSTVFKFLIAILIQCELRMTILSTYLKTSSLRILINTIQVLFCSLTYILGLIHKKNRIIDFYSVIQPYFKELHVDSFNQIDKHLITFL